MLTLLTNIMTIMKKPFTKYLVLGFIFIGTIILIVVLNIKHSKVTQVLNYPLNYSLCNASTFDVVVYSDNSQLSFLNKENIASVSLTDGENNYYLVRVKEIYKGEKVLLKNHAYYPYTLTISMPLEVNNIEHWNQVLLNISNKRGELISFKIGNISMVNGDYFSIVEVQSLIGMTLIVDNYTTLDKIKMEVHNFQHEDVILKSIRLVSNVVTTEIAEMVIESGKTVDLEIPIIYLEKTFINEVGLILKFEYQGIIFEQLINAYTLFKTSSEPIPPVVQVLEVH